MIARGLQVAGGASLATFLPTLPAWTVALLSMFGMGVLALALLMPQQSADRLEWWRSLFGLVERRFHRRPMRGERRRAERDVHAHDVEKPAETAA